MSCMRTAVTIFLVTVRNDLTGEVRSMDVVTGHEADARVEALVRAFREGGWRKSTALTAEVRIEEKTA